LNYPTKKQMWRDFRAMCRRCVGGSTKAIRNCQDTDCPAWPYRLGSKHYREASQIVKTRPVADRFSPDMASEEEHVGLEG